MREKLLYNMGLHYNLVSAQCSAFSHQSWTSAEFQRSMASDHRGKPLNLQRTVPAAPSADDSGKFRGSDRLPSLIPSSPPSRRRPVSCRFHCFIKSPRRFFRWGCLFFSSHAVFCLAGFIPVSMGSSHTLAIISNDMFPSAIRFLIFRTKAIRNCVLIYQGVHIF